MPLPDRPVTLTPIASEWGQQVHDYTFAPKGCELSGTTRTVNTTADEVDLSIADDDPGGFLDAGDKAALVPTGGEGLYLIFLRLNAVGGDVGTQTRAYIYLNGSPFAWGLEDNNDAINAVISVQTLVPLVAGDRVEVFAQRRGTGTNPTVHVQSLQLLRVGAEYGA